MMDSSSRRGPSALLTSQESDVLILDEPPAGLDRDAHRLIRAAVDEELRRGVTVIESTHSPEDIERADRVVTLAGGSVISDTGPMPGSPIGANLTA